MAFPVSTLCLFESGKLIWSYKREGRTWDLSGLSLTKQAFVQFAMAARHLSQQAGSVFPLKTLTQEQVAQVQQQIQTSNQFQSNLQVADPAMPPCHC